MAPPARRLGLLLALSAGCGGAPSDLHRLSIAGVPGAPIPSTFTGNAMVVPVAVDGVAGGALLVDTGSPVTVIAPGRFAGANVDAGAGRVASLSAGGLTVEDVPVLGADLFAEVPDAARSAPAGLLGGGTICQFAVVLDYRGAEVRLSSGAAQVADVRGVRSETAIPFSLEGGSQGEGSAGAFPATRIPVQVEVEGARRQMVLDTGASEVVLRHALFEALVADGRTVLDGVPIASASGRIEGRMARTRAVLVEGAEVVANAPALDVGDALLDALAAEVGHPVDGLLGGAFLREFLLVLDYPSGRLRLFRYATREHIDPDEFHQVGIALGAAPPASGHVYAVARVFAGTRAEAAGLRAGEVLSSVDGRALDGMNLDAARAALRGTVGAMRRIGTGRGDFDVAIDDLLPLLPAAP